MHFTSGEDTCNVVEVGNICNWVTDVQSYQYYQHGIGFQIDLPEKENPLCLIIRRVLVRSSVDRNTAK